MTRPDASGFSGEFGVYGPRTSIWCDRCARPHKVLGWAVPGGPAGGFVPHTVEPHDPLLIRLLNRLAARLDRLTERTLR